MRFSGASYGYKPYVMTHFAADNAQVTRKDAALLENAALRNANAMVRTEVALAARDRANAAADSLLTAVNFDSSTREQRDNLLTKTLNAIRPGLAFRVQERAAERNARGFDPTTTDNIKEAVVDELSGDSIAEWLTEHVHGRGAGARFLNTVVDWHCSPASTAVGSAILGAFFGPAVSEAGARGATEIQGMARCDIWSEVRGLAAQLGVSRETALALLQSGKYVKDPSTGTYVLSASLQGVWIRVRPVAPLLAIAGLVALVASKVV